MRSLMIVGACMLAGAGVLGGHAVVTTQYKPASVKRITWDDVTAIRAALETRAITAASFDGVVERIHTDNLRRVREGDLDHLIFYTLQSTRFTKLPAIEPALSAKAFAESLDDRGRAAFLGGSDVPASRIQAPVRARSTALMRALDSSMRDARLTYFRELVATVVPRRQDREAALLREYVRVMRFVYQKEFVAQRSDRAPEAVAELYRTRGLSTDTAVEAGYLVSLGLGVVQALEPGRRIRRVLIIGPGLDLAPRTALIEDGPPESYQPWAIIDALLTLGLSRAEDLEVVGADINPRVVQHLRRAHDTPPSLTLVSEVAESDMIAFTPEFRDYFKGLGRSIGDVEAGPGGPKGHLRKTVRVHAAAARRLRAQQLDIVTERLDGRPFDLVVVTNVLPYFDDVQLMLAMSNIASMLAPGGVLLHNEARSSLRDLTAALGLPFEQSRHVVIATVRGAAVPLFDSVWIHRLRQGPK